MTIRSHRTINLIIAAAALSAAVGCAHSTRDDDKKAAVGRWQQIRSGMIIEEARSKFENGDLQEAERKLVEAAKVDPTNPALYTMLGRIGIERGMLERANNYLKAAIEVDDTYSEAHYFHGIILQRWQRFEDAYNAYWSAYENTPDNPAYLLAAAEMLIALDREDEALARLKDKQIYFEGNAGIRSAIAQIYMTQGKPREAIDYYNKALVLDGGDTQIMEELAVAQVAAGEHHDAIASLQRLLAMPGNSKRIDLRQLLAESYGAIGRNTDARDVYYQITRAEPTNVEAWIALGETAWQLNDLAGALTAANRVISLAPNRHEGYLLAGLVWHKRGAVEPALQNLDRAAELSPEKASPWIIRGLTLERAGRTAAAAESYREALKRDPQDRRAQSLLARVQDSD